PEQVAAVVVAAARPLEAVAGRLREALRTGCRGRARVVAAVALGQLSPAELRDAVPGRQVRRVRRVAVRIGVTRVVAPALRGRRAGNGVVAGGAVAEAVGEDLVDDGV